MTDSRHITLLGNQNAQKLTAPDILHVRVEQADKQRWILIAGKNSLELSQWVRDTLNKEIYGEI